MIDSIVETICTASGWTYDKDRRAVAVTLAGGRTQVVRLEPEAAGAETFVRLISSIGSAAALDPRRSSAALRLNAELRYGAFAIVGDDLAVVETMLVGEGEHARLQTVLEQVARSADRYEQVVFETDTH